MVVNNGFSYVSKKGNYFLENDNIVSNEENEIIRINASFGIDEKPILLELAAIEMYDTDAIISFCNKYGRLGTIHRGVVRSDYNSNVTMESFMEYRIVISRLQKLLALRAAAEDNNYADMIKNAMSLLLSPASCQCRSEDSSWEYGKRVTSDLQMIQHLMDSWYNQPFSERMQLGKYVNNFMDYLMNDPVDQKKDLYLFIDTIRKNIGIKDIDTQWNIIFTWKAEIFITTVAPEFLKNLKYIANQIISQELNQYISEVSPVIKQDGNKFYGTWNVNSLLELIYLELFLLFSQDTKLKKCLNPTCPEYFIVTGNETRKKYCSNRCGQLMAKRNQREREKTV